MAPPEIMARSMADAAIPPMPAEFPRNVVEGENLTQEELDALDANARSNQRKNLPIQRTRQGA
eukprot:8714206-Prorocentrum_lima.AAC.1